MTQHEKYHTLETFVVGMENDCSWKNFLVVSCCQIAFPIFLCGGGKKSLVT